MACSLAEVFERSRIAGQACLSAYQSGEVLPHSTKGMEEAGHMRRICLFRVSTGKSTAYRFKQAFITC